MKKNVVLKVLFNILCFLYLLWLTPIVAVFSGRTEVNGIDFDIYNWNWLSWFFAIMGILSYVAFLQGLFFLRRIIRVFSKDYLSEINIENSSKVGVSFILSGLLFLLLIFAVWLRSSIITGFWEIGYNMDALPPLILLTIGVFFKIQAENLLDAKIINDEVKLTV